MLDGYTVKTRLIVLVALPLLFLAFTTLLALSDMRKLNQASEEIFEDLLNVSNLQTIQDAYAIQTVDALSHYRNQSISLSELRATLESAESDASNAWQYYLGTDMTSEESRRSQELNAQIQDLRRTRDQLLNLASSNQLRTMDGEVFDNLIVNSFTGVTEGLRGLISLQDDYALLAFEEAQAQYRMDQIIFLLVGATAFLISLAVALTVFRSIQNPLDEIGEVMTQVVKESDLKIRAPVRGNNEISLLGYRFNGMLENFHSIILSVKDATDQLAAASEQLSSVSEEVSTIAREQEEQTTQIATAITEMAAAIEEVASSAQSGLQSTEDADRQAKVGRGKVSENMESMESLSDTILGASERLKILDERTEEIVKVMEVIQGIAEQTNLLALNAAIEAARAGEQGRGFAVVADEVRTLAQNTKQSTETIQETTERLRRGAREAVEAMDVSSGQVAESVELSRETRKAFGEVTNAVEAVVEVNVQISSATEEQATVANQVTESVNGLSDSISQVVTGATECASASSELSALAQELKQRVEQFKVAS